MTRRRWTLAAVALLLVVVGGVVALPGADRPDAAARAGAPRTEAVTRGPLSAQVSGTGTLTYRARPDGSPYAVVDQATGTYTQLPRAGDVVRCGHVLYRVDDRPVVLLCGAVPAYRTLRAGAAGPDVRQLNRALRVPGRVFTARTQQALRAFQRRRRMRATGTLPFGQAVFLPEAVRVAKVTGQLGGPARSGAPLLTATSGALRVRVDLDASQQGGVKKGARARVTLPGNEVVRGRVAGFGRVAQAGQGSQPAAATVPTFIDLAHPARAGGLDQAPVQVDMTTKGVDDALSVPVTALLGRSGGGYAVEVARPDRPRALVAVRLGLFDTGGGRVQVEGDLRAGDRVVVPSL